MTKKASDWQPWSLISQLYPATAGVFAFLLFLYLALRVLIGGCRGRQAPEAGGAWPLIGHLRLLGGPKLPHEALGELADKYGPIFTIRIGIHLWEMARTKSTQVVGVRRLGALAIKWPNSVAASEDFHHQLTTSLYPFSPI